MGPRQMSLRHVGVCMKVHVGGINISSSHHVDIETQTLESTGENSSVYIKENNQLTSSNVYMSTSGMLSLFSIVLRCEPSCSSYFCRYGEEWPGHEVITSGIVERYYSL